MLLKVPSSQFQALFEEILSSQPEPMNRQFPVRKSKSEALQLYAEKKIKQRENVLFPTCKLQIDEVSCACFILQKLNGMYCNDATNFFTMICNYLYLGQHVSLENNLFTFDKAI